MSRTTVRATDRFLVDAVRSACGRLARGGWLELLRERHGLDLAADDLAGELSRPLDRIDRSVPGFEDFAAEGVRGIEPGSPARSLMFHALASPRVRGLDVYPTPAEIEAVENYVYGGVRPPSVEDLREQAGGAPLAIVVYAREYRPADGTAHRRHADMCFSRTGVARIGTSPPVLYGAEARGYLPFVEGDGHAVRVLPCRYAAYIAARVPGHANAHGPMRFIEPGDSERRFWIPLHKLFSGDECLRGHSLTLRLTESHVNEKLRRVHLFFLSHGHDAGWGEPDISRAPFVITSGIAKFSNDVDDGAGLLVPQPRASLVERAIYNGAPLTFEVPETTDPPGRGGSTQLWAAQA